MESKLFISQFIKKDGVVNIKSKTDIDLFKKLCNQMKNGDIVEFCVDFSSQNGLLSQISKIKAGTREIAKETGHTFIEIEHEIKKQAGLYNELTQEYKSLGNCSMEELSSAIQILITIGEVIGLNLK